jgi:signal transduction histidine kinase
MPIKDLEGALRTQLRDDALIGHFLTVWPVIESILESFSRATRLPIFVYLNSRMVFQSSMSTMPPFCAAMLNSREMASQCIEDGRRRACMDEREVEAGVQFCHAGMVNGRCEIATDYVGSNLVVLYGSRRSLDPIALRRRELAISKVRALDPHVASKLENADQSDEDFGPIRESDKELMAAISVIIEKLLGATVGFRSLTINMAHELSLVMLGIGLLARELGEDLCESDLARHIVAEARLGLYVVRNFLSYTSINRYKEATRPQLTEVDLSHLVEEMVALHHVQAAVKDVQFQASKLACIPKISGFESELERLFHNIFSNAIKYSYRSTASTRRFIKVSGKNPYDPGFRERRFAISIENYGLGLEEAELQEVLKPGFRGHQAIAEVPIGAGIGLSESYKIMQLHGGDIRVRSKLLHGQSKATPTYLTTVDLIFPL